MNLPQEISTLIVWVVTIDLTKRVEMRKVFAFVVRFRPTGLLVCAFRPLVDAALDLTTTGTIRQRPG